MEKYFQDPQSTDIDSLLNLMNHLNNEVERYTDTNASRLAQRLNGSYLDYLSERNLPYESNDPYEVMSEISELYKGAIRWHHPGTMINVNPPANLPAIAASAHSMLYNPNFAQDMSTGSLIISELEVIKYLSELAGWNWKNAHGIFTFGGKSTNMHAVKIGLQKAKKELAAKGVKDNYFIVSTEQGHPCHAEVCDWLGIGKENCIRVPVDGTGQIIIEQAEEIINDYISRGHILACIIGNGGTTIQMTIDPIEEIAKMRDRIVEKNKLDYSPHIHIDSVIGWAFLFFKYYDFEENKLGMKKNVLEKIRKMTHLIKGLEYADSFGADFHKTGFCPYVSSVFITKDRKDIYELGEAKKTLGLDELEYGNYSPFLYTLELSRSATGPMSALVSLKCFGISGYQKLISNLMNTGENIKETLDVNPEFEVINHNTDGFVTLFIIKPSGYKTRYKELLEKDEAREIAEYNYHFYLYLLEKQAKRETTFVLDYSTGYDTTNSGIKIGVLKAYPMSPFADEQKISEIILELFKLKEEYDQLRERNYVPKDVPHRPRHFVFR